MQDKIRTVISENNLSIEQAIQWVQGPQHGAMDIFVGSVREINLGRQVVSVEYDVFIPLAQNIFQIICEETLSACKDPLKIYLSHFKGKLPVGGISVVIAVGSPHRAEAFSACRSIIEALKQRAPIWKQEAYIDGLSKWVQGHALCQHSVDTHEKNIL